MEQGIKIKVIVFPADEEDNPLPYVPALCSWIEHVQDCVPCARVDQLANQGRFFDPAELCEGGAILQLTVTRRIAEQHITAAWN